MGKVEEHPNTIMVFVDGGVVGPLPGDRDFSVSRNRNQGGWRIRPLSVVFVVADLGREAARQRETGSQGREKSHEGLRN